MAAQRPSSLLKDKTNVNSVTDRPTQATAEDFYELGEILENHADLLDQGTGYTNLKPELKTTKTLTTETYIDCSIAPSFILPTPTNNIIYDVINIQENKDIKLFVVGSAFTLGFTVSGYNVTNLLDIADGKKNIIQLTFLNNECLITNVELS